jgi:beta propeller repeat protein
MRRSFRRVPPTSRRALLTALLVSVTALLVFAALAALAAPPPARAGHIQSRFSVPDVPDPDFDQSDLNPHVDGTTIYFRVSDWSFAGEVDDGYRWVIGSPAATAFAPARDAQDVDGGIVVYETGGESSPVQVRATNGVLDVLIAEEAGGVFPGDPAISGDTIVWSESSGGGTRADIRGVTIDPATLAPGAPLTVCAAAGRQTQPAIDGDIVAWKDRRNGNWDIYARNLATSRTKAICRAADEQSHPSVGGTWIAWVDYRNAAYGADIYARRWSDASARAICHARKAQKEVCVGSGGFIVWTDWRNSASGIDEPPNTSIRGYDMQARETFVIDGSGGMQFEPDIEGSTVVYLESADTHMGMPWWCGLPGAVLQH